MKHMTAILSLSFACDKLPHIDITLPFFPETNKPYRSFEIPKYADTIAPSFANADHFDSLRNLIIHNR